MSQDVNYGMENLKADIVVIGSGGGLAAAVTAAEAGAKVILLEKENILGGYTRQAYSMFACETAIQKRQNVNITAIDCLRTLMQWSHSRRVDPRVAHAFFKQSAETITWLEAKGVEFELMETPFKRVMHQPTGCGPAVQKALIKSSQELGIRNMLYTSGKKILIGDNGQVAGVLAVNNKSGKRYKMASGAAIIATGSFADNREMLKKYCPDFYDGMYLEFVPHHAAHSGDGIYMAQEIGAGIADSVPIMHIAPYFHPYNYSFLSLCAMATNRQTIWVNKRGRRFTDEAGSLGLSSNAFFQQPGKVSYTLFDDAIRKDVQEGLSNPDRRRHTYRDRAVTSTGDFPGLTKDLQKEAEKIGRVKIANSWDEIAKWIGCDPKVLKAEIVEYNSYCDKGCDEIFTKDKEHLKPLHKPPYYAMKCDARVGETLGGIKVNEGMEILNTDGDVIKGAYAAGVIADGFMSEDYGVLGGVAVGFAINSGRIAGRNAAKFMLEK